MPHSPKFFQNRHGWTFGGFILLLFIFYPGSFLAQMAPLTGDHLEQHYPWAVLLARCLKHFQLPFWTPELQCGFPIAAESQIGIFYPPNLLLSFLLPVKIAYSYMSLVHFLIAGYGTCRYAKKIGLSDVPSFTCGALFILGAAYGGAYYNITSLKTIAWFPIALWLFENSLQNSSRISLIILSFCIGISFLAGYLQMAVLTWLIFVIYGSLRIFIWGTSKSIKARFSQFVWLGIALAGAGLIAFPQIILTYPLAMFSNRLGLGEDYAYIGSLSPFSLITLLNPFASLIFRGNNLYHGQFAFLLVLLACSSSFVRRQKFFQLWAVMGLIALLLALGRWSPVYPALIKITHFYSFRFPAKFLGFICFAFSILAGFGLEHALANVRKSSGSFNTIGFSKLAAAILGFFLLLNVLAQVLFLQCRSQMIAVGEWYVRHFISGRSGHPHSLSHYLSQLDSYATTFSGYLSWLRIENLWVLLTLAVSFLFIYFLRKYGITRRWIFAGLLFCLIDLYGASWFDIQRDYASYAAVDHPPAAVDYLIAQKKAGRLERLYGFRSPAEILPIIPSLNMLYGIEDIGIYSPFVMSRYYETLGLFGNINDSNSAFTPSAEFLQNHLKLLSALGVSHILSKRDLAMPLLKLAFFDEKNGVKIYKNLLPHRKVFFTPHSKIFDTWDRLKSQLMAPGFDPYETLLLENDEAAKVRMIPAPFKAESLEAEIKSLGTNENNTRWKITVSSPGFFVFMDTWYPGWGAAIDGHPAQILKAYGMFRAVWIGSPGIHEIQFFYHPFKGVLVS